MSAPETRLPAIAQGEDFYIELTLALDSVPIDLTGATFAGQLRASAAAADALADFVFTLTDAPGGKVAISLSETITAALPAQVLYFDVFMAQASGVDTQILRGQVQVIARITRP